MHHDELWVRYQKEETGEGNLGCTALVGMHKEMAGDEKKCGSEMRRRQRRRPGGSLREVVHAQERLWAGGARGVAEGNDESTVTTKSVVERSSGGEEEL